MIEITSGKTDRCKDGNSGKSQGPIVLNPDASIGDPGRIPFTESMSEERWPQDLTKDHLEILPMAEIEPALSPRCQ